MIRFNAFVGKIFKRKKNELVVGNEKLYYYTAIHRNGGNTNENRLEFCLMNLMAVVIISYTKFVERPKIF